MDPITAEGTRCLVSLVLAWLIIFGGGGLIILASRSGPKE